MNWVDWVIIAIVGYYIIEGWEVGLVSLASNSLSFLASLWLAIKYHTVVGDFFTDKFGISPLWAEVLGYVVIAFATEYIVGEILRWVIKKIPQIKLKLPINKIAGAVLSAVNALIIAAFVMLVVLSLPLRGSARQDIKTSYLGSRLVRLAEVYGGEIKSSLDQVTAEAVKFLTVKPSSSERVDLKIDVSKIQLKVDEVAERQMLELVNAERAKVGVKPLKIDPTIVPVARAHSRDMFERSYFSHVSPEGHEAGYRLDKGGVDYTIAGENLAFAPDVQIAHKGLMDSEGHRKNILEPKFGRIGIGVIDGGFYGEMFTQNFAD